MAPLGWQPGERWWCGFEVMAARSECSFACQLKLQQCRHESGSWVAGKCSRATYRDSSQSKIASAVDTPRQNTLAVL
ncbi:hypothetical protein LIA77_07476 [Sarocladium implicatum]|nr:hypothetical protein LIA77_07476 [Sarocladium implicatum]